MIGKFFADERQVVFAVHDDTRQLHIHMVVNTVAYTDGNYKEYFELKELRRYAEKCIDEMAEKVWFGK